MASCSMVAAIAQAGLPEQSLEPAIELLQQMMKLSWAGAPRFQHNPTPQQRTGNSVEQTGVPDAEGSEDEDDLADVALESLHVSDADQEPSTVGRCCTTIFCST